MILCAPGPLHSPTYIYIITPGSDGFLALAFIKFAIEKKIPPQKGVERAWDKLKIITANTSFKALLEETGIQKLQFIEAASLIFQASNSCNNKRKEKKGARVMKFNKRCIIFLLACFWLSAIVPTASAGKTLQVGASPVITSSGIFLAKEEGFFKEFGLDVEITIFKKSGAPQTVLLSNGDLDVGGGSVDAGFWNAINQGVDIKLVADKGHIEKGASSLVLLVRQDHLDSGRYKSLSDLKGFTMALTTLTGTP